MHIIRPLPVEYIVSIAETLRGRSVLIDGYDGAALVGCIAELATDTVAYRPHLYTDWDTAEGLSEYVTRHLLLRGVRNFEVLPEGGDPALWSSGIGAPADAIVIDPGPDRFDVAGRVRAALSAVSLVVVIDQARQYTAELTAIAGEQPGFIYYGEPPVVYNLGPDRRAIIPLGGQ